MRAPYGFDTDYTARREPEYQVVPGVYIQRTATAKRIPPRSLVPVQQVGLRSYGGWWEDFLNWLPLSDEIQGTPEDPTAAPGAGGTPGSAPSDMPGVPDFLPGFSNRPPRLRDQPVVPPGTFRRAFQPSRPREQPRALEPFRRRDTLPFYPPGYTPPEDPGSTAELPFVYDPSVAGPVPMPTGRGPRPRLPWWRRMFTRPAPMPQPRFPRYPRIDPQTGRPLVESGEVFPEGVYGPGETVATFPVETAPVMTTQETTAPRNPWLFYGGLAAVAVGGYLYFSTKK
jgi:hypothetical protein